MKETLKFIALMSAAVILGTALPLLAANAADKAVKVPVEQPKGEDPAEAGAEKVNVENIKEKYWARGDESELGVVQNRLYSKARKLNLGLFGGFLSSDPFLSTRSLGGRLGFHFNETWSLHAMAWKSSTSGSSALEALEASGKKANTNPAKSYAGGEVAASVLYGKLSLLGKKILYYDMHVLAGAGATATETGTNGTYHGGIGQQVFLTKWSSLRLDYRVMYYTEEIREKEILARLGQSNGTRGNWTHAITLGFDFFIGKSAPSSEEEAAK